MGRWSGSATGKVNHLIGVALGHSQLGTEDEAQRTATFGITPHKRSLLSIDEWLPCRTSSLFQISIGAQSPSRSSRTLGRACRSTRFSAKPQLILTSAKNPSHPSKGERLESYSPLLNQFSTKLPNPQNCQPSEHLPKVMLQHSTRLPRQPTQRKLAVLSFQPDILNL